jgi:4-amino-4-deoxy-L-arabinose transferase-like glycosyltransferase
VIKPAFLAAAALGLALRLLFSLGYWIDQPLTRDEREYLSLARSLAAGRGFEYDAAIATGPTEPFGRAPGYPAFLALVGGGRGVVEHVPAAVKIAQSCVGAIGVMLAGVIAARLAGVTAGRVAAWIAAVYPPLVWIAAYAYSEALIWPVGLALVWLFDRAIQPGVPRHWLFAAGALAGVATLIRPATLLFLALAALWLIRRRSAGHAVALAIGGAVVLTPWIVRTYAAHDRFVLVASEGGVTFWTGNHPLAIGEGDMAANPELKRASLALRAQHPGLSEEQMEPVYYGEAFGWIAAHPWRWLMLEIRKIFYLIVPIGPSYRLHSFRYYAASFMSYALILPPALLGIWMLRVRRRGSPGLMLLAASAVAICLIFFPQERFRIPILDPALIVCAAALAGVARERADA